MADLTPTYRVEILIEGEFPLVMTYPAKNAGAPTEENLAKFVGLLEGSNDFVIEEATIIRQANGDVVAEYLEA